MTVASTPLAARPRLRPEVVLGPAVRRGGQTVHHMKDTRTGRFFQIGPRELFIISRLDGHATLAKIGTEYATVYGRHLGGRGWHQILGLLATRRLLTGTADDDELAEIAESTAAARRATDRRAGWWRRRIRLVDPDRLLGRVAPRLRVAFSPFFVLPAVVAITALEVFVATKFGTLRHEAERLWERPALGAAVVGWLWLGVAMHELAHGLASKHYGGTTREIGLIWLFPLLLAPYCKVEDVILFPRRRQRVYTAFAGVFTSLLLLLPIVPVWALAPPGGGVRHMAAAILLFGSLAALVNLLPFFRLDGYFMLAHGLGMHNLSEESRRFLAARMLARRRRPGGPVSYSRRDAVIYAGFGLGSVVGWLALLGGGIALAFRLLQPLVGAAGALAALGSVAVAAAVIGATASRLR